MFNRFAAASIAAAWAASALAQNTAVTLVPNAGNTHNNGNGYSLGYEFTVGSAAVNVTSLGYFDNGSLTENHEVGIYDMSGNLLLSGTVDLGTSAVNYFAYTTSLTGSNTLAANTNYEIMGVSGLVDVYTVTPTSFSTDPDVTFVQPEWTSGNTLAFGQNTLVETAYFGPNFTFGAPAPEPVSVCLLGMSAFGLAFRRRMKAKTAR